jgi:hypothetical protein
MLAVDTEEVAVLEASLHPTTEAPPVFPEEPVYTPPAEEPPNINEATYIRLSPSGYSLHLSSHSTSPEPLPVPPPHIHPLPQDNPDDPRNRICGLSEFARERLFHSDTGLAAAQLMLARQEEVDHPLVVDPDTHEVHRVATPLSSPSETNKHSTPVTTADSLPSHYTIEVNVDDLLQDHPLEDWIRFDPDLHRTAIQIPATEAEPLKKVPARFVRFRVEPITGKPTIYGTMGVGRPIYAESLEAAPASWAAPTDYCDNEYFKVMTEERMIGGPLERVIEDLGDYRVKADIICLRNLESDRRKLALRLQEVQALEAYTQKRRAEFGMYQLAHVGHTKAVQQRLVQANAREHLLQLVDEDSERGELAWQHRTQRRRESPYTEHGTLRLRGGARSAISWNSENAQDNALAQDKFKERCRCSYCPWFDHLSTHCKTPHHLCSARTSRWCRVPRHHRYFNNQMPNTCPYGGRRKHTNGHYLTCQHTAWQLSLED